MKIGLRTIKTTLAIALCAGFMEYVLHVSPFFGCIGAFVAVDNTIGKSIKAIIKRNFATIIGGIIGMVFTYFTDNVFILALGVMVLIILLNQTKYNEAILPAAIVYLGVVYIDFAQSSATLYALSRVAETFIGTVIGLAVNLIIKAPEKN